MSKSKATAVGVAPNSTVCAVSDQNRKLKLLLTGFVGSVALVFGCIICMPSAKFANVPLFGLNVTVTTPLRRGCSIMSPPVSGELNPSWRKNICVSFASLNQYWIMVPVGAPTCAAVGAVRAAMFVMFGWVLIIAPVCGLRNCIVAPASLKRAVSVVSVLKLWVTRSVGVVALGANQPMKGAVLVGGVGCSFAGIGVPAGTTIVAWGVVWVA